MFAPLLNYNQSRQIVFELFGFFQLLYRFFLFINVEILPGMQVAAVTEQEAEVYHIYRTPFLQENAAAALLKQVSSLYLLLDCFDCSPDECNFPV